MRSPRTAALGAWTVGDSGDEALVGMCFTSTVLDEASLTSLAVGAGLREHGARAGGRRCALPPRGALGQRGGSPAVRQVRPHSRRPPAALLPGW